MGSKLVTIMYHQSQSKYDEGILVLMEDEANALNWSVLLANFPPESALSKDMKAWQNKGNGEFIKMEVEV